MVYMEITDSWNLLAIALYWSQVQHIHMTGFECRQSQSTLTNLKMPSETQDKSGSGRTAQEGTTERLLKEGGRELQE